MKICVKCGERLPYADFDYKPHTYDKKDSHCKKCTREFESRRPEYAARRRRERQQEKRFLKGFLPDDYSFN